MGTQTEATVTWGLHLDCDEVLAIIKELEKQEKERTKQEEEKQYEEKSSSSPPAKNLRDFLYNLVPEDLKWRIIEDPDSKEGQTVIIYNPEVSSSAERWGSENCMFRFSFFSHHRLNRSRWMWSNSTGRLEWRIKDGRAKERRFRRSGEIASVWESRDWS